MCQLFFNFFHDLSLDAFDTDAAVVSKVANDGLSVTRGEPVRVDAFLHKVKARIVERFVRTPPEKPKAKTAPATTFFVTVTVTLAWYSRSTPSTSTSALEYLNAERHTDSSSGHRSPVKRVVPAKRFRRELDVQFLPETSTNSLLLDFGALEAGAGT